MARRAGLALGQFEGRSSTVGFALFIIGLAAFAVPLLRFMSQVGNSIDSTDPTQPIRW